MTMEAARSWKRAMALHFGHGLQGVSGCRLRLALSFALAALLLVCVCRPAQAWDEPLINLARDFAKKDGPVDPTLRAVLLQRNRDINLLAMSGRIDIATYQACQRDFVEFSEGIAASSAKAAKVKFTVQQTKGAAGGIQGDASSSIRKSHPVYLPGTDSDYITGATNVDQVRKMKKSYNKAFEDQLKKMGASPAEGTDWTQRNDVDFMADAKKTSAADFKLIAKENNAAYTRPGAARYEAYSRSAKGSPLAPDLADMRDYVDEMQDMVHHRETMIKADSKLLAEVRAAGDAAEEGTEAFQRAKALEAEIYKNRAMQGKYVDRIAAANENLRGLLPPNSPNLLRSSNLPASAKVRDMLANPHNPALLASIKEELIGAQVREHVEMLASLAKDPKHAKQCQESIARLSSGLSPQQKAEVIGTVRAELGDDAARDLATTLRGSKPSATLDAALGAVRKNGSRLSEAVARADGARVRGLVAEMEGEISRARGYAGVADGAEHPLSSLNRSLAGMSDEELEAALRNNPTLLGQIDNAARAAQLDASLLDAYAHTGDARKRAALKRMLLEAAESEGVWGRLRSGLTKANDIVPFDRLVGGLFAYWDALEVAQKSGVGDMEGAARKAFEAVVSAGASLPVTLTLALTNAMLDAAKEGGFRLAVNSQDAEDLLAGIIAVKGWESAEGMQTSPETSIDKLARNCTTESQVRSIVAALASAAAAGSDDTPTIRRGKQAALNEKCGDEVVRLWRARRMQLVMDYIAQLNRLQAQMDQLPLEIRFDPSPVLIAAGGEATPVRLEARADASALAGANETLDRMKEALRALGGSRQLADLRIKQKTIWTFDGSQSEESHTLTLDRFEPALATSTIPLIRPGNYGAEVRIVWNIEVLNAIEGIGDHVTTTVGFTAMLQSAGNLFTETRHQGDPLNTYEKDMERPVTASGEGYLEAKLAVEPAASPTPTPTPTPTPLPTGTGSGPVPKEEGGPAVQNSGAMPEDASTGFWDRLRDWIVQKPPTTGEQIKTPDNKKPQGPVAGATPAQPPLVPDPTVPPQKPVTNPPAEPPPAEEKTATVVDDKSAAGGPALAAPAVPSKVVYGTTQIISGAKWITEASALVVPEAPAVDSAAVQNAGKPGSPINSTPESLGQRGKDASKLSAEELRKRGMGYSMSPLDEGTGASSAPDPAPTPAPSRPKTAGQGAGARYLFKSSPEIRFNPVESAMPESEATFTRAGRVTIWIEVLAPDGRVLGTTKAAEVDVAPPTFELSFNPPEGAKSGQQVEATVTTSPAIDDDLLDFRWMEPETSNRQETSPNASRIRFRMAGASVHLHVVARVPHFGDALGEVRQAYTGSEWSVGIRAKRRGPVPPEWTAFPKTGGDNLFAADEQFSLEAVLAEGNPPDGVRWKWTVNGGTTISNDAVSAPTVSRHEPGEIQATAEARDPSGKVLGKGEISLSVVSEDEFIKPLAITIKLDAPSVEVGKKAVALAEVTGGRPPYVLAWNPAGSGAQLELMPKEEGSQNITVTVRDARKKEAKATASLSVTSLPLEVSLKPDRLQAMCGESVALTATTSGGTKPYRFRWTAPATGKEEKATISSFEEGQKEAGIEVTDAKGRTAQAGATIIFDPLQLAITGLQPKEALGSTRTAKAGEKLPQGVIVKFRTTPALPIKTSAGSAEICFAKPGQYEVRAAAYATVGGVEKEIAQSAPVKVAVAADELKLVLDPMEMAVGDEASARLVDSSGQPPKNVRAEWTFSAGAGGTPSGTAAKIRPDAPGSFPVSVSWKDAAAGTAPGQASATLKVKPLSFEITVDPAGGDEFLLRAKTSATIPNGLFFHWTATGAEFSGPQEGASVRVRISEGGKAGATATATNARRVEIGRASVNFDAPEKEKPDPAQQAQKHVEKGFQEEQAGRLEAACAEYENAVKLVPDPKVTARIEGLRQKLTRASEREEQTKTAQALLNEGFRKETEGDLSGAIGDYMKALPLISDGSDRVRTKIDRLTQQIRDAGATPNEAQDQAKDAQDGRAPDKPGKAAKAQELLNEAFRKESAGDLQEAVEAYMQALALHPDDRVWARVEALENRIRKARSEAAKERELPQETTAPPSRRNENPSPQRQAPANNPLIAQKKAEVLRLSNEALAIGNSMMSGNFSPAAGQKNVQRVQQIQSQIQRLNAEINRLEAGQ